MFVPLIIFSTFCAIFFVHFLIKDWHYQRKYAHIPGPPGLPIVGNLLQINREKPYLSVTEWSKIYGPIIKVNLLGTIYVFANDYESLREVYDTKGKEFGGREKNFRSYMVSGNTGIIRMDSGPELRLIRRLLHSSIKAFGPGMSRIEHFAIQTSEEFINTFKNTKGKSVDPLDTIYNSTLRMISLMLFGCKVDEKSEVFSHMKQFTVKMNRSFHLGGDGPQLDIFPWLRFFGNKTYKLLKEIMGHIDPVWQWYKTEIAPLEDSQLDDKIGQPFCRVMNNHNATCKEDERLSENEMKSHVFNVIFAGIISTTTTLYEVILLTISNPGVKEKLVKEINDVVGNRLVSLKDRLKMPYTHAVIHETLRYCAGAPVGFPHRAMEDTELRGYMIPKDTLVFANMMVVLRDDSFFGDASKFRPERYLDENGQMLPADDEIWRHSVPFGAGPRVCAGQLFAMYRLFLWTVSLFQRFDIQLDPEKSASTKYEDFPMVGQSVIPANYFVRFIPRDIL